MKAKASHTSQALSPAAISAENGTIRLSGRLDSAGTAEVWDQALRLSRKSEGGVTLDLSGVDYLDGSGAAIITELRLMAEKKGIPFALQGVHKELAPFLQMYKVGEEHLTDERAPDRPGFIAEVGKGASQLFDELKDQVEFVGQIVSGLITAIRHPRILRWKDIWVIAENAGVNAMPIIILIGLLMGLIMSFQSAVPLQRFGADIYIADLLGISMVRELGPLVTAILLAGRSGSAFAAEIGTMKVNEEVDALRTMGLDPVKFLAVPRVLSAMLVTPILTIFFDFFALVGGAFVVRSFGYAFVTYATRVQASLTVADVGTGLFKALIFSLLVAGIGCRRGLATGTGAVAVGASTTSSVVSGLILIAVADGVFTVVFYVLGI